MWESEYQRALLEARRKYVGTDGIPARLLRQMYLEYAGMIMRIHQDVANGVFRNDASKERARELMISIRTQMDIYRDRMALAMDQATREAVEIAVSGHIEGASRAAFAAGVSVNTSFAVVPSRVIELMMIRRGLGGAETFSTIINRGLELVAADVDQFISSVVGRGEAPMRAAGRLAKILSRGDKEVLAALDRLGPRGGLVREAIKEGVEIDAVTLAKAKKALSDSRMIIVSEIQNSFFEADRQASVQSPLIDLVHWKLSGRHAGLPSSPDICDYYATQDLHGYGPGLYHPETIPAPPHPNDQCQILKVLRPPLEWSNPPRPLPDVREDSLDDFRRNLTKIARGTNLEHLMDPKFKYVENQYAMLRGIVLADRVARRTRIVV